MTKAFHGVHTFYSSDKFPEGTLPTKHVCLGLIGF